MPSEKILVSLPYIKAITLIVNMYIANELTNFIPADAFFLSRGLYTTKYITSPNIAPEIKEKRNDNNSGLPLDA